MAYTPPAGDSLAFNFTETGYSAPAGDSILIDFVESLLIELEAFGLLRLLGQLPQVPLTRSVSGVVTESGSPVARTVRLYKRGDGALIDETTSGASDGAYSFSNCPAEPCYVVALDDEAGDVFNALILDRVKPGQDFS